MSEIRYTWRYTAKSIVLCLNRSFTVVSTGKVFFIRDIKSDHKYWFPAGTRRHLLYVELRKKIIVFGAVTKDSRQLQNLRKVQRSVSVKYLDKLY